MNASPSFSAHHSKSGSAPTILELAPVGQATLAGVLFAILRRVAWAIAGVIFGLIGLRVGAALWLAGQFSHAAQRSAAAGGWDATITTWLQSVAAWGFGFGVVGLLARSVLGWFVPFGRLGSGSWKPMMVLMGLSALGTATPVALQKARGLGPDNLPAAMMEVDPALAPWFSPSGESLLFFADHLDGVRRFWNRPGHTPRDNIVATAVTTRTHAEWLREELAEDRAAAEARLAEDANREEAERRRVAEAEAVAERQRHQQEHEAAMARIQKQVQEAEAHREEAARQQAEAERIRAEAQREWKLQNEAVRKAAEEAAVRERQKPDFNAWTPEVKVPSPSTPPPQQLEENLPATTAQEIALRHGMTLNLPVHGDRVAIWSDGPIAASADHFSFCTVSTPGHELRFLHGAGTLHVRPLNRHATRVFVRKLD